MKTFFEKSEIIVPHHVNDLVLQLNEARQDERRYLATRMARRLETMAAHIAHNRLTGVEAAEALRTEAARIESEAGEEV